MATDVLIRPAAPADLPAVRALLVETWHDTYDALLGAERVTEELSAKLGIKPGETDPTGTFTLIEVECLGACDRAPVVMVNDDWHEGLSPEQCSKFIDDIRARGSSAFTGCHLNKEVRSGQPAAGSKE